MHTNGIYVVVYFLLLFVGFYLLDLRWFDPVDETLVSISSSYVSTDPI